jgi:hypothetical protein
LTDERILSYCTDEETGELFVERASFSEIRDTAVDPGDPLEDTVLTVVRRDGGEFALFLSVEAGRDRLFLLRLGERLQR